jgi:hypothetical protein
MLTNRFHFWMICRLQRKGNALLQAGESLNSPRLLRLSWRVDYHCRALRSEIES